MKHLSCFKSCFSHETTDYSDTLVGGLRWHNTKSITENVTLGYMEIPLAFCGHQLGRNSR